MYLKMQGKSNYTTLFQEVWPKSQHLKSKFKGSQLLQSSKFLLLIFAYDSSQYPLKLLFTWKESIIFIGLSKVWGHYRSFVDLVKFDLFSSDFFSTFKDCNFFNFQYLRLVRFAQYHLWPPLQVYFKDQSQIMLGRPWNSLRHNKSFSAIWDLEFSKLHYQILVPTSKCHNFMLKHPNVTFLGTLWSFIWCQHIARRNG
jgi:hypothetical protein